MKNLLQYLITHSTQNKQECIDLKQILMELNFNVFVFRQKKKEGKTKENKSYEFMQKLRRKTTTTSKNTTCEIRLKDSS